MSVVGRLLRLEIRPVEAHPVAHLLVPPDELLPLGPRPAVGSCRGAVVQDSAVVLAGDGPVWSGGGVGGVAPGRPGAAPRRGDDPAGPTTAPPPSARPDTR